MTSRVRPSNTVDCAIVDLGRRAIADGRANSLSGKGRQVLDRQVDHEPRLAAVDEFVTGFETKVGPITDELISEARAWEAPWSMHLRIRS